MASNLLKVPDNYSLAALHVHSVYSDGMETVEKIILAAADRGIGVLALTDHDTVASYKVAKVLGKKFGVDIVMGEEIQTSLPRGLHIIGLFLKDYVAHSRGVVQTIKSIREQGGLAIIAHPMVKIANLVNAPTGSFQAGDIMRLIEISSVDGVEIRHPYINDRDLLAIDKLYEENMDRLGAKIGSSDSHFGQRDLFSFMTLFKGSSSQDLFKAIENRTTQVYEGIGDQPIGLVEKLSQNHKSIIKLGIKRYAQFAINKFNLL